MPSVGGSPCAGVEGREPVGTAETSTVDTASSDEVSETLSDCTPGDGEGEKCGLCAMARCRGRCECAAACVVAATKCDTAATALVVDAASAHTVPAGNAGHSPGVRVRSTCVVGFKMLLAVFGALGGGANLSTASALRDTFPSHALSRFLPP